MASHVVVGMASKQIWETVRVKEVMNAGRNAHSSSNIGYLIRSFQFSRSTMHEHGEGGFQFRPSKEGIQATTDHATRTHFQNGNTLKDEVTKLTDRVKQGIFVNSYAYNHVLQRCSKAKDLESVKQLHESVKDSQMEQDPYVANMLLKCYMECGRLETAQELFNKLLKKTTITWNMMIAGCVKHDQAEGAIETYKQMRSAGGQPDAVTYLSILKACSNPTALRWGKEIHDHIISAGLQADARVANALIHMYAKTRSLNREGGEAASDHAARAHLQDGSTLKGAVAKLIDSVNRGTSVNSYAYNHVLQRCLKEKDLESVKQVHDFVRDSQMEQDPHVANMLLKCYMEFGTLETARELFNKLLKKGTITWTMMIAGFVKYDQAESAMETYKEMRNEGGQPNAITYLSVLKACASPAALKWGKDIHADIVSDGLQADLRVANALVLMYAKTGLIADAKHVFDKMRMRDVISWNVMIGGLAEQGLGHEAFSLFLQMQREGFAPDALTCMSILNPCSSAGAEEWLKEVHAHALQAGLEVDVQLATALVQMYAKTGLIADAKQVFDKMRFRDVISWNVMIGGLAEQGLGHEAFSLFLEMQREGIPPTAITYLNILNPCSSAGAAEWLKEVHAHAFQAGLEGDVRVGNALVRMYAKTGLIADAKQVFDKMGIRDVISWNVMIGGLAEQGLGNEAFSLFLEMQREGISPDALTFMSILNPCSSAGAEEWLKEVHAHALQAGLDVDVRLATALVRMYTTIGLIDDAKQVFDSMRIRDVISWTVMIGGLAEQGLGHEAFSLFLQMQREGIRPDAFTYVSILNPCSSAGAVEWLKEVHAHALQAGLDDDVRVGNALVQMFAKTGLIADAKQVFDKMRIRDVFSWTVMIGGLAQHGHGREALQLFEEMESDGVKPDEFAFVAVLTACSHAGLVEEGRSQFDSMMRHYGIEPDLEHYNCVVDMLGRAGRLQEAQLFILNMPIKPNVVTWMAYLGACRTHQNVELAELAARECMKLRPTDAAANILLSNVYASVGSWDRVSSIRRRMQEKRIRKEPGRCSIEVGNKVHEFLVGDTSHPETREIYNMLSSLSEKLKAEGYVPDTRLVLRNIAEEDKQSDLCSHSEKLAIAYGLMHVPHREPIRVYKTLRICTDCHTATKLISKITGREIVARDANRFHHFKDGSCSCGDYW